MRNQWLDIDLDYFNSVKGSYDNRMRKLKKILKDVDRSIPCRMFVEHHHVLPFLRKAVKEGDLQTPFDIFRVDEHHDYYYGHPRSRGVKMDCGNFGYCVNVDWYKRFFWVTARPDEDEYWPDARKWILNKGLQARIVKDFKWSPKRIGLVSVVVSPDYQELGGADLLDMIKYIEDEFDLDHTARCISKVPVMDVNCWEIVKTR